MAVIYNFDDNGAFLAADTQTRRSAYAYPTSPHAAAAKKNGKKIAHAMMESENADGAWRDAPEFRQRDEERIRTICNLNIPSSLRQ
ncbi:MAG: hypothetical protein AB7F35_01030 [Acetobacteraceae bacterium]